MTAPAASTLLALQLRGGIAQAQGLRSMKQLAEPGPDPDSAERLLAELLEAESDSQSLGSNDSEA